MEFEKLKIDGLVLCKPKIIEDKRGFFAETFRKDLLEDFMSEKLDFCQNNPSKSSFGVLRGLHFQPTPKAQPKLVLGKLPLHDGVVDSPYGLAVFSGSIGETVSGSEENIMDVSLIPDETDLVDVDESLINFIDPFFTFP